MENRTLSDSHLILADLLHQIGAAGSSVSTNFDPFARESINSNNLMTFTFIDKCIDLNQHRVETYGGQIDFPLL